MTGVSPALSYGTLYKLFNFGQAETGTIGDTSYDFQKVRWNNTNGPITITLKAKKAMKSVIITASAQCGRSTYMGLAPVELRGCSVSSGSGVTFVGDGYRIASVNANATITLTFSKIPVTAPNSSTTITSLGLDNITFLYKDA